MDGLNDAQQRHVLTTFHHVDEVLSHALSVREAMDSPFCECEVDLEPACREALLAQLRELRAAMQAFYASTCANASSRKISESWLVRTAIVTARIDFEEIRPRYLRAYGEVPPQMVPPLEAAATDLLNRLHRMEALLPIPPRVKDDL
jgi:hypothetical protein